jgi:hypothetical protein
MLDNTNRYSIRYNKLISFYLKNQAENVFEKHHIIPKCMGGSDDQNNLVKLPPRAHFLAHYFLYKAFPNSYKLKHAFAMMIVNNPYQFREAPGKLYERARKARSEALKGSTRPEWVKEKLRKPKPDKTNYAGPKSTGHKAAIAAALKGKQKPRVQCHICGKLGSPSNISRWHNTNCKHA